MVDSITEEDLNRIVSYIDMKNVKNRTDYERQFEDKFKKNIKLKNHVWDKRLWKKITGSYKGKRRSWSDSEEQFLRDNLHKRPVWLAKHFPTGRTYQSIYQKRRRLL